MKDFRSFIYQKAQDKTIVNAIGNLVSPIFASTTRPIQEQIKIAQAIENLLSLFKEFDDNKVILERKAKDMQSTAISSHGGVDKGTLDFAASMNILIFKLSSTSDRVKTKRAIESAFAYVASVCVSLERRCHNEVLDTVHSSPVRK